MKIVYLIAGTFNAGGMERVLSNKANWLAAHGYDVAIVTTDQRGREPYFKLDGSIKSYDLGINYDADNGRLVSKLLRFPLRQWRHKRRLEALLRELRPDVTVCMFNNDVSFVHRLKDGSRKILEVHFSKNKKLQYGRQGLWAVIDRWRTQREERLVDKYDHFVVLTHEDKALWDHHPSSITHHPSSITHHPSSITHHPSSITHPPSSIPHHPSSITHTIVIPNARTFVPQQHSSLTAKRVVAVGRYDYQKGFNTLLYIWHLLGDRLDGWTLDIIGDGPLRREMEWQVGQWHLTDSVRLLRPTDDIESVYLGASILVMTSRYEGLPMVLLEAQACGLPIVAFACQCGPRDVITDGKDGFLIEGRDERLFADRLLRLMTDDALRQQMGRAAAKASERFSEERVMQQWEELVNEE